MPRKPTGGKNGRPFKDKITGEKMPDRVAAYLPARIGQRVRQAAATKKLTIPDYVRSVLDTYTPPATKLALLTMEHEIDTKFIYIGGKEAVIGTSGQADASEPIASSSHTDAAAVTQDVIRPPRLPVESVSEPQQVPAATDAPPAASEPPKTCVRCLATLNTVKSGCGIYRNRDYCRPCLVIMGVEI